MEVDLGIIQKLCSSRKINKMCHYDLLIFGEQGNVFWNNDLLRRPAMLDFPSTCYYCVYRCMLLYINDPLRVLSSKFYPM
mgnify:CR=1 FL=1